MYKDLKLEITVNEEGKLSFKSSLPTTLEIWTQALQTTQLNIMRHFATKETTPAIYDMYNTVAANVLQQFDPTSKQDDLTAEAILRHENEILEEHWKTLSEEEKQQIINKKGELLSQLKRNAQGAKHPSKPAQQ